MSNSAVLYVIPLEWCLACYRCCYYYIVCARISFMFSVFFLYFWLLWGCLSTPVQLIVWKVHLWIDVLCVKGDIKHCIFTTPVAAAAASLSFFVEFLQVRLGCCYSCQTNSIKAVKEKAGNLACRFKEAASESVFTLKVCAYLCVSVCMCNN